MDQESLIYVAGHRGLVGSAIIRCLEGLGYSNILTRSHQELDLREQAVVEEFFDTYRPEYVFLAAAKVGGILANSRYPAEFIYDNIIMEANVINAAYRSGVKKLLFLGSSCIYPRLAPQPLREEYLLTGPLEATNEWYAIAKIAGIKLCQAYRRQYGAKFIAVMPTNLYGINDNFDLENSHVLPALIRKFHEAKIAGLSTVTVWGSGEPKREFLYVDDLAAACCYLMKVYDAADIINIGTGQEISISQLAALVKRIVGYSGEIVYDKSKPDGTPRKVVDTSKLHQLGWQAETDLETGVAQTYRWFVEQTKKDK